MFIINRKPKELKPTEQKIKITVCQAFGPQFENLIPDSIHDVIETPARHKNSEMKGVWVMGIGEPVKVLNDEYTQIK